MNNYCIYIRNRKGNPYCKLLNKEITFSCCQECDSKEYKTKNKENSFYKSNSNQIRKMSTLKEKNPLNSGKMKNKSNKLAKLEKDRFSVFSNDKEKCYLCGSIYNLTWHEIFRGANRKNSMKFGFCLRLCLSCHEEKQENIIFNDFWHRQAQLYFEEYIGSREEFLKIFRRNYLE